VPWLLGLVLVAVAGGAIYVWYQNREEETADAADVTDEGVPPEDQRPGSPPPPPPPTQG